MRQILADIVVALAIGIFAYAVSCWLVPPDATAKGFGEQWQLMSRDPFALAGELPQRVLTPLLAWVFGYRGAPDYVLFTRGLSALLLVTIAFFCRRRGATWLDAAMVTFAVAVISPVQMYKLHWVGYCDALTYALFFGMVLAAPRPGVFWSLFFLNLMNHELAAFLLPWAWFVRRQCDARRGVDAAAAAVTLGVYAAYYVWVKAHAPQQVYSSDYFLANPLFPGGSLVVVALAILHWTVAFGPVLAVLSWHQHASPRDPERRHLWWVLAGIAAIFCIAFDWSRHCHLLVIPLVIAAQRFLAAGHRAVFAGLVVSGAILMQLIPPWPTSSWPTVAITQPDFLVATGVVVPAPSGSGIGFGKLSVILSKWLPQSLPTLLPVFAILAAIWAAGFFFARGTRRPAGMVTAVPAA